MSATARNKELVLEFWAATQPDKIPFLAADAIWHLPTSVACKLTGRSGQRLLLHDCDGTRGDSGSPILIETAAGWRIVGLTLGVVRRGSDAVGLAATIPEAVRK